MVHILYDIDLQWYDFVLFNNTNNRNNKKCDAINYTYYLIKDICVRYY